MTNPPGRPPHDLQPQPVLTPAFNTTPVGTVVAFSGKDRAGRDHVRENIEAWGWMMCDGRTLPVNKFRELFSCLGYLYGGDGDIFKIPDYREYFLPGADPDAHIDLDANHRQPPGSPLVSQAAPVAPSAVSGIATPPPGSQASQPA